MPYTRTTWQDYPNTTTPITAARLNNIELGILAVEAAAGTGVYTLNAQTGTTYTLVLADGNPSNLVTLNNASAVTLTIPTNASVAFPVGSVVNLVQLGAGQVTVSPSGGVTLRSNGTKYKIGGQYGTVTLVKINTDEWLMFGNTAA